MPLHRLDKTSGEMFINGYDVSKQGAVIAQRHRHCFQESTLDDKLTIEENLRLHCDFYRVPKNEVAERINFVLNLVDLEDRRKTPVKDRAGGMKRRAEIARGLVHYRFIFRRTYHRSRPTNTKQCLGIHLPSSERKNIIFSYHTLYGRSRICQK